MKPTEHKEKSDLKKMIKPIAIMGTIRVHTGISSR